MKSILPGIGNPAWAGNLGVRFGMTPAFLHDQHSLLEDWRHYMTRRLGVKVEFTQRDSYRETMDLLRLNQLDFAWVCDYPYLHLRHLVRLLAVPLYQGKPVYHSYLIVNARDAQSRGIADLRGQLFAYADPYSNSGYLVPRYQIHLLGEDPERFFKKSFFTWSHRKVVEAVASGLAQGGAVDSYVWDTLAALDPELTRRTRIAWKSPGYGFPPMVAHRTNVGETDFQLMQELLLGMSAEPEGQDLLKRLNLDGFSVQSPELYDSVAEMMRVFGEYDPA
ncbi:PhnD/SsuA/transferrin family substrate-binding protein [Sedimenticola hydrogenitrophicus]|uniref:substrate-binding domain-containing protein n=1 Tax=Sedimenticola hydrogenitrophicus TaxID=2967975 RepID=UPI0021A49C10|nr:PhnD/SsuA/transferrin family substrate-binding protein [Sedimenticola hydrogenitrophicus]